MEVVEIGPEFQCAKERKGLPQENPGEAVLEGGKGMDLDTPPLHSGLRRCYKRDLSNIGREGPTLLNEDPAVVPSVDGGQVDHPC